MRSRTDHSEASAVPLLEKRTHTYKIYMVCLYIFSAVTASLGTCFNIIRTEVKEK